MTKRWLLCGAVMMLSGCRVSRGWNTTVDVARGETVANVWMVSRVNDLDVNADAGGCASPTYVSVGTGLNAVMTDWDGWEGECWALLDLSLDADAPDRTDLTMAFHFDLCDPGTGVCLPEDTNQTQERTLVVYAQ